MSQVVVPGIPRHYHVGVSPTVEAGEGGAEVLVAVLLSELRTVHSGRIPTAFCVDEESRLPYVPLQRVYVHVALEHGK